MHTDGVTVFSQWPLRHFFDYIFSFDSIVSNLQYPRECQGELWIIVRGDRLPCGGNRGARCPFPLPTMVTWQGRCPTTGLLTSPFVVRSPPLCCPRSGLTILLFCRVPLTVVWFPSGVHPDAAGFSAVGIALGCVGCRVSLHMDKVGNGMRNPVKSRAHCVSVSCYHTLHYRKYLWHLALPVCSASVSKST